MRKKVIYKLKYFIAYMMIAAIILPTYATSVADGSAFVTKAEFDTVLAEFDSQLTAFEASINSKIDTQVTTYLDRNGIWSGRDQDFATTWNMTDNDGSTKSINIGQGCSWGEIFGINKSDWHISWEDTNIHKQKGGTVTTWAEWETIAGNNYDIASGYNALLLGAGEKNNDGMVGMVQWSPTLGNQLENPNDFPNNKIESVSWEIIPKINKSGLLFLDFGQVAKFDPYMYVTSQWQNANWDTGLRYDFSIVFRRFNVNGDFVEDPWEEHWGNVVDSKIMATKTVMLDSVHRVGNDSLPYSISSAQINISTFRKAVNFFVTKNESVRAVVKTVGFNQAESYLGRADWSYDPENTEIDATTHEKGHGDKSMAIYGPEFKFYKASVY